MADRFSSLECVTAVPNNPLCGALGALALPLQAFPSKFLGVCWMNRWQCVFDKRPPSKTTVCKITGIANVVSL